MPTPTPTRTPTPTPTATPTVPGDPSASFLVRRDAAQDVDLEITTAASRSGRVATLQAQSGTGSWDPVASVTLPAGTTAAFPAIVPAESLRGRALRVHLAAHDDLEPFTTAVLLPPAVALDVRTEGRFHVAEARTTGQVDRVVFFVDGVRVSDDLAAPWTTETPVAPGRHDIVARAVGPVEGVLSSARQLVAPVDTVQSDTGMADGFALETVQDGFELPTSAAVVDEDLVLVTEKSGVVRALARTGNGWSLPRDVLDLRSLVFDEGDAGLVGIAIDPAFAQNGFVYVSYVLDEGVTGAERRSQQVARYTWDGAQLDATSGHVVLGSVTGPACHDPQNVRTPDCIPLDGYAHTVGDLGFDPAGNLLVGVGDGSLRYAALSARTNALRVQDPEVLVGKVLRVNPDTGRGVPGNPLYAGNGSANSSRVLALGFRNPFRFALDGDHLVVGDVGEGSFEEIDLVHLDQAGDAPANFGWPCLEGTVATDLGDVDDPENPWHVCAARRASGVEAPDFVYRHTSGGGSVTAGVLMSGTRYPATVRDLFLYGDYAQNHLRTVTLHRAGGAMAGPPIADSKAAGGPVKIFDGPDGWIWSISIYTGAVQRLTWSTEAPVDTCATGELRRSFHDLDGPGSTFDRLYPEGPARWLQPYNETFLPTEVLAPPECVSDVELTPTSGSPWATVDLPDTREHPGDRFGVSWRGRVPLKGGTYRFRVRGSEWMRLRVDDVLLHDFYSNDFWGDARTHDVVLEPGVHAISVEYVHGDQETAVARVTWEQVGVPPVVELVVPDSEIAADGSLGWEVDVGDSDGDAWADLVARTRVVAELLHYDGNLNHVHPYRQVLGQGAGTMTVDDVHAPGHGVIRLWAETTDASGATGRSAPVYACFAGGDVGPCAD